MSSEAKAKSFRPFSRVLMFVLVTHRLFECTWKLKRGAQDCILGTETHCVMSDGGALVEGFHRSGKKWKSFETINLKILKNENSILRLKNKANVFRELQKRRWSTPVAEFLSCSFLFSSASARRDPPLNVTKNSETRWGTGSQPIHTILLWFHMCLKLQHAPSPVYGFFTLKQTFKIREFTDGVLHDFEK